MELLLNDFHFVRPLWLLAFVPAIALIVMVLRQQHKQGQWHQFLPAHLASILIEKTTKTQKKSSATLLIIASIVVCVSLAGPTWQRVEQPLFKIKRAQIIIADMSLSMYATDLLPNRLTRAKFKVKDLVSRLSEGETALIAYAGDAFVISPMTQDVANLENLIPSLNPQIMPVYGSRPSWAVEKALELLAQTNYTKGTIYLITDGMEPSDAREITALLKNTQFSLNILGVGTRQGAPIKLPNEQLLKNDNGNIVIPKLQSSILRGLTNTLSGRYSNLTNDQADIDYLTSSAPEDELDTQQQDNLFGDEWHEVGPYLVLLLLPFAVFAFRRGVITLVAMTLMIYPLASPRVMAGETVSSTVDSPIVSPSSLPTAPVESNDWWRNLWETKNQQGLKSFNDSDFSTASSQFDDPQWRGVSQYKQGNFEQALTHFNQSQLPESLYNQANTLAKLGQFDEAIARYEKLLQQQTNFPNAKKNLELVKKLAQQKKQQQKQDGEGDDKGQSKQDPSDDQEKSDEDNKPDGEKKDKQGDEQQDSQQSEQQDGQKSDSKSGEQSKKEGDSDNEKPPTEQEKQQLAKQEKDAKQKQQMFNKENLTPEQLQRLNRLVKKIPDDPSLLLKNKMALEARKRQHQRVTTKERKQW